jgi:hypothetical protein
MKLFYLFQILLSAAGCLLLAAACSDETDEAPEPTPSAADSLVRVEFNLPSRYAYAGLARTRAAQDDATSTTDPTSRPPFLDNDGNVCPTDELEVGETVWLSYTLTNDQTGASITNPDENTKPYVVLGYGDTRSLYACGLDSFSTVSNDRTYTWYIPNTEVSDVPLYLSAGTYNFRIMSPALPIAKDEGENNYCMLIENGIYFCSSDERYANTKGYSQTVTTEGNTSGLLRVTLRPMVWQVAQLKFYIMRDPKSPDFDLGILDAGIEVSGLQNHLTNTGDEAYYNWRSSSFADTIEVRRGDKSEWVRLRGSECTVSQDTIYGDIGVLPTDAMSTDIVVLFNLTINGVPTQYETTVTKKILRHGHSYKMNAYISMTEGITALTWYNQSWTTDVAFNATK